MNNRVLVFAGTTEGRMLYESFIREKINSLFCVATEYGKNILEECEPGEYTKILTGRLDEEKMCELMTEEKFLLVIDATHPYATEVTKNIVKACQLTGTEYIRFTREINDTLKEDEHLRIFENTADCVKALHDTEGNILLTTGSKELYEYASKDRIRDRLFVRVLPGVESIRLCEENGIKGKHIIAMQGPFSLEMNEALIRQFDIRTLVTKESGVPGGFYEKIEAVKKTEISCFIISKPDGKKSDELDHIIKTVKDAYDKTDDTPKVIDIKDTFDISLVGCGMGNMGLLTEEAKKTIEDADIIFGSERLLESFRSICKGLVIKGYSADTIIPDIDRLKNERKIKRICVLFSGDTGFFSGSRKLISVFKDRYRDAAYRVLPGISSVAYLASKLMVSYDDAFITSIHGDKNEDRFKRVVDGLSAYKKAFVLLSGVGDIRPMTEALKEKGLYDVLLHIGLDLSSKKEKLISFSVNDDIPELEKGSAILFMEVI